ncbi:hypothetical protein WJX82_003742 [Trebouxia sp. C0006]
MWDDLAGVPAKLVNCLHVHDVNFCQQVCRDWRKAIKTELETVAVAYAQPVALSSFANLKHLSTFMCPYGLELAEGNQSGDRDSGARVR